MAYACPVCASLAPDGEHLAHHLAIVAMTRGGEHEAWLDDHAAGWRDSRPEALAATATQHAETVDHELADEAAGERPDVGHEHGGGRSGSAHGAGRADAGGDEETAAVLAEAREITQRMLGDGGGDGGDEAEESEKSGETDDSDPKRAAPGDEPTETDSDE